MKRRRFLQMGLIAALVPACKPTGKDSDTAAGSPGTPAPERPTEPAAWEPEGSEDRTVFPHRVQVGDATDTTAIVALFCTAASVTLVLVAATDVGWEEVERQEGLAPTDGFLQVTLSGLAADTAYSVVAYADATIRSAPTRFRTALAADGWRQISFGATSCLGSTDVPWPSLSHAAGERVDFFCLLGDLVYADGSVTLEDYRAEYAAAFSQQGLLDLTTSTSFIATWDDHEVDNNWSWESVSQDQYDAALQAFTEHMPMAVTPGVTPIWRKLSWGAVLDVFVLDCRSERLDGDYISTEQMDWLKEGLAASTARFKIILNSVPITDLSAIFSDLEEDDRWDGFPEQRSEILSWIAQKSIQGVLWVTGDVHYAQIGHVDPEGGIAASAWEVLVGPAGSTGNVLADVFVGDPQYAWLSSAWNWCRFDCDPGLGTIRVRHFDDTGAAISDMTLGL